MGFMALVRIPELAMNHRRVLCPKISSILSLVSLVSLLPPPIQGLNIPFAVGSLIVKRLLAFVDSLGWPDERFMENLRLLNDIFALSVSKRLFQGKLL